MSHEHATPPELAQALDQIFRLVRIHSAESFSYSRASIAVTTTPPPVGDEKTRRLVSALRDTLYARCYARAPVDARSETADAVASGLDANEVSVGDTNEDSVGAKEFARRLSAANR